ncbi:MAG: LysR family transcriptional regulator, partial [Pseudomonadota bacterium]
MERSNLSVKWLEVFQVVSRCGSVRDGAAALGISVSTASDQLASLERAVGAALLDHSKRPMRLTSEGETLLRRVDEALGLLRKGVTEIWTEDLTVIARTLRIAHVEDFETDVGPELARQLSRDLPACTFAFLTRPSHEVLELLQSDQVDIGIASAPEIEIPGVAEEPLLNDPFLLVLPQDAPVPGDLFDLRHLAETLPLLRYSKQQMIGRRIAAQLARESLAPPSRMTFESTHAILSMVAAGQGWAVTTALNYQRAQRYQDAVRLTPLPGKAFARQISLFARRDLPPPLTALVSTTLRRTLDTRILAPALARHDWLGERFHLSNP